MPPTIIEITEWLKAGQSLPDEIQGIIDSNSVYPTADPDILEVWIHDFTGSLPLEFERWWLERTDCLLDQVLTIPFLRPDGPWTGSRLDIAPAFSSGFELPGVRYLSSTNAPEPDAIRRLVGIRDRLATPAYRDLVDRVLGPAGYGNDLVTAPGSHRSHHSEPGGLLRHTVEVAEAVESAAGIILGNDIEIDTAVVTALLHDVGKLVLAGPDRKLVPVLSNEHDRLIEYAASDSLCMLREGNRDAYDALWHVIKGFEHGDRYHCPVATLIRACDAMSARTDLVRKARKKHRRRGNWVKFKGHPPIFVPAG